MRSSPIFDLLGGAVGQPRSFPQETPMSDLLPRREFFGALAGSVGALWLGTRESDIIATAAQALRAALATPPEPFTVLTPAQAADVEAFTALIVPSDGSPGAREAHVVYFVDKSLGSWAKGQRPDFEKGWKDLSSRVAKKHGKGQAFAALTPVQQTAIVAKLEKDKSAFFEFMRGATILGMFANPEYGGNYQKAGWKMLGFDDRFSWQAPYGWYDANAR
jgi:gluconate 2-dehydrogenase gamma chain